MNTNYLLTMEEMLEMIRKHFPDASSLKISGVTFFLSGLYGRIVRDTKEEGIEGAEELPDYLVDATFVSGLYKEPRLEYWYQNRDAILDRFDPEQTPPSTWEPQGEIQEMVYERHMLPLLAQFESMGDFTLVELSHKMDAVLQAEGEIDMDEVIGEIHEILVDED